MCFSMSASCSSRRAASKMPPQFGRAAAQLVVPSFEVVEIERVRPEYLARWGVSERRGLIVTRLQSRGAAERAGL